MDKGQSQKETPVDCSTGDAEEDDNGSWVEIESLASLDSLGDAHQPEAAALEDEDAQSASSAADSPNAADLFLDQNRETPLAPRKRTQSQLEEQSLPAESRPAKKAPRWWRLLKRICDKAVESTLSIVHRAKPVLKRFLRPSEKPNKVVRWFLSIEGWNWMIYGSVAAVVLAGGVMIAQSRTLQKALSWKQT